MEQGIINSGISFTLKHNQEVTPVKSEEFSTYITVRNGFINLSFTEFPLESCKSETFSLFTLLDSLHDIQLMIILTQIVTKDKLVS